MKEDLVESSTSFDGENVRLFLERIVPLIDVGFGTPEVDRVTNMLESMDHDDEEELAFEITVRGAMSPFRVRVFMDDIDSPDVYFFAPPALAEQIDHEMDKFAEELGI